MFVKDLNNLHRCNSHYGLYKKSLVKDEYSYSVVCYCLKKIAFSIQDINNLLKKEPTPETLILIVAYLSWIQEATEKISGCYKSEYVEDYTFKINKLVKAVRSFILAHPSDTNRHPDFGFDGDFLCLDIKTKADADCFFADKEHMHLYFSKSGLRPYNDEDYNYVLFVSDRKKHDGKYLSYTAFDVEVLVDICNETIDYLYQLDRHLYRTKIKT